MHRTEHAGMPLSLLRSVGTVVFGDVVDKAYIS